MYDIKKLNIWKESSRSNSLIDRYKVLQADVSKREETIMSEKCKAIYQEIMRLVPTANLFEIKERRKGKIRFPIYINKSLMETNLNALDLSMRSSNCLHRAGFETIGELVEAIESSEDLKRIRNCGAKSIDEIMEQLFCYQYGLIPVDGKVKYIKRVLELNNA